MYVLLKKTSLHSKGFYLKKVSIYFLVIVALGLLTGCYSKKITRPFIEGTYSTNVNEIIFNDNVTFDLITIDIKEITKEDFTLANSVNVMEDMSLDESERKYYQFEVYFAENSEDSFQYDVVFLTPHNGMAPDTYKLTGTYNLSDEDPRVYSITLDISNLDRGQLEICVNNELGEICLIELDIENKNK